MRTTPSVRRKTAGLPVLVGEGLQACSDTASFNSGAHTYSRLGLGRQTAQMHGFEHALAYGCHDATSCPGENDPRQAGASHHDPRRGWPDRQLAKELTCATRSVQAFVDAMRVQQMKKPEVKGKRHYHTE